MISPRRSGHIAYLKPQNHFQHSPGIMFKDHGRASQIDLDIP